VFLCHRRRGRSSLSSPSRASMLNATSSGLPAWMPSTAFEIMSLDHLNGARCPCQLSRVTHVLLAHLERAYGPASQLMPCVSRGGDEARLSRRKPSPTSPISRSLPPWTDSWKAARPAVLQDRRSHDWDTRLLPAHRVACRPRHGSSRPRARSFGLARPSRQERRVRPPPVL